ncbi:unnamed protein product [Pseudo-nitzschia multistriata]|uniref:Deacetylase sirtuin-type domain-containing protein n=1 Tax=Pseudo-nitzschia multistriata TaxID=183589 RepID=A0A448ZCF0_9STRA|nr:unnamed protein product [Pseudo-nitzschia multistriata]
MPPIARRRSSRRLVNGLRQQDRIDTSSSSDSSRKSNERDCTGYHSGSEATDAHRLSSAASSSKQKKQKRRRSSRGHSCLAKLAEEIVTNRKRVVLITGAGMSVASGIRPFRGKSNHHNEALWTQHIWTTATRETFRKDPLEWYNRFWLPFSSLPPSVQPNAAHRAVQWLLDQSSTGGSESLNIKMITQNVDGMLPPNPIHTIEAHGRLGLYKCIPDVDSDTDSESDDDDGRSVHLGHRRKWKRRRDPQRNFASGKGPSLRNTQMSALQKYAGTPSTLI